MIDSQVFAITRTENMILAKIDATDEAYSSYIKRYIARNFKFFIHLKESILVFPKGEDRLKRQFFIGCLLDNFNKTRANKLSFEFNPNIPFFVEFSDAKNRVATPKVQVKCHNDFVFFRFSEETGRIVEFLKKSFFGSKIDVDYDQKIAKMRVSNEGGYRSLCALLSKNIKLNDSLQVKFSYNEEELARLNSYAKTPKNRYFTEFGMMELYYKELNSSSLDSFATIKKRYLELIKIYHPDKVYGKEDEVVRRYTVKFRRIQNAFEQIKKMKKVI